MNVRAIACACVASSLFVAPAFAKDSAMVLAFEGKQSKSIHDRVIKAVKKTGVTVTPPGALAPKTDDARKAAAKKKHVTLFLEGTVAIEKGTWTLSLESHGSGSGGEGTLSLDAKSQAGLFKKIDAEVPDFVRTELASTSEPEKEPEPSHEEKAAEAPKEDSEATKKKEESRQEKEPDEDKPREEEPRGGRKHHPSPLALSLGGEAFSRHFSYKQDVNGNLRPYDLGLAAGMLVALEWYPGAHFTAGPGAHVGIVGDYERGFPPKSVLDASGAKYSTTMQAFSVGLRGRFPLGAHELGLSGRFGKHAFTIDGDVDPSATSASGKPLKRDLVPDVSYSYLEPALDLRLGFGDVSVSALVGYRIVVSAGDIEDPVWFPAAKASALHARLGFSYELVKSLCAFVAVDLRRYGFSMHSKPSDVGNGQDVAGGAIDQYLAAELGLSYRLPGN